MLSLLWQGAVDRSMVWLIWHSQSRVLHERSKYRYDLSCPQSIISVPDGFKRLRLTVFESTFSQKENVDEDILVTGHGPFAVEIDLMMPLDANKAPKVKFTSFSRGGEHTANAICTIKL